MKLTKQEKIDKIIIRLVKKKYVGKVFGLKTYEADLDGVKITLCTILNFLKKRFKLKELTNRELYVIGGWRYNKDDIRFQYRYTVDLVYYLVFLPKIK